MMKPGRVSMWRDASIAAISRVEQQGKEHLYWPGLEVDLSPDIIENPEKFPKKSKS